MPKHRVKLLEVDLQEIGKDPRWFNDDPKLAFKTLKALYHRVLKYDSWWHFFYEGMNKTTLRFSPESQISLCRELERRKVKYSAPCVWRDGNHTVRKYQTQFVHLFHLFAVIAMKSHQEDLGGLYGLSDRVVHCFLNAQTYNWAETETPGWSTPITGEAHLLGALAINRALHAGQVVLSHQQLAERPTPPKPA